MTKNELNYVQVHIDYHFKNPDLLEQAFTRSSYAEESGGGDNEILEFIGDKALDFVVVKYLAERWGGYVEPSELSKGIQNHYYNELDEGELTEIKAKLVQKKTLSRRIEYLGFEDFLMMGKSDTKQGINHTASVKEDLFEAIIGAVTLDSNWNLDAISHVVENMLEYSAEIGDEETLNYVGQLQDWSLAKEGELPLYHVQEYSDSYMYTGQYITDNSRPIYGPRPRYMCYAKLPKVDAVFLAFGDSQNEARRLVAKRALEFIEENGLQFTIRDEIPDLEFSKAINQLETLARRGYFPLPTYDFEYRYDENGNPIWTAICHVEGYGAVTGEGKSVKVIAKKDAAWEMLKRVLGIV